MTSNWSLVSSGLPTWHAHRHPRSRVGRRELKLSKCLVVQTDNCSPAPSHLVSHVYRSCLIDLQCTVDHIALPQDESQSPVRQESGNKKSSCSFQRSQQLISHTYGCAQRLRQKAIAFRPPDQLSSVKLFECTTQGASWFAILRQI